MAQQVSRANPSAAPQKSTTGYKIAVGVLIIIILALAGFIGLASSGMAVGNQGKAETGVKELYKILTGSDVEVLKSTDQDGIYKITVRFKDASGTDTLQDIYVTRDGLYFTDRLVDLELQKSILKNQSSFAQCLADKQVRILGLSTDAQTQAQMQQLGAFSSRIYFDCGGNNQAICQQLNITRVPVIFYNNALVQGPQNLDWFQTNTGCYMTENATKPA